MKHWKKIAAGILLFGATTAPVIPQGNGLISVALFDDGQGKIVEMQIADNQYDAMGQADGNKYNPTKNGFTYTGVSYQYPTTPYLVPATATSSSYYKNAPTKFPDVDEYVNLIDLITPKAKAAIAFDAATKGSGSGTSLTYAHTVTGSNVILFVSTHTDGPTSDVVTGITYNSDALTHINTENRSSDGYETLWYLIAPDTGSAYNVVVSLSSSAAGLRSIAASYTGAAQTGQPDAQGTSKTASAASLTNTLVSVADNAWHVGSIRNEAGSNMTAGSGTTLRTAADTYAWFDNDAAITPAGSNDITANWTGNAPAAFVAATFAPVAVAGGAAPAETYIQILEQ